ncbi:MAG TPA: hypothetical protein VGZ02_06035 [Candidatus Baltobacteraceae bacterium]|jgi:hypothetical protein|nr:hypothetical protein [Candidatus Baltobacteraceae bacterium]
MKTTRALGFSAFFLALVACIVTSSPAFAVTQNPRHVTYDVAIKPQTGIGPPRTGILVLTFNAGGIVNGTYRGTSIAPDPLNNRITQVTGGIQNHQLWIDIGMRGSMRFSGTLQHGNLSLSGFMRGRMYTLTGAAVH